jgi:hypothetical protein
LGTIRKVEAIIKWWTMHRRIACSPLKTNLPSRKWSPPSLSC